jgi:hypothetical protein
VYSILHISDLHRSPDDPITNAELVSSLRSDRYRYTAEDPMIRPPDAIVVSGDIVQGVKLGATDALNTLRRQYEVAEDFLGMLADEFLAGDRSKVVVVPGNHDVDWNVARAAMEEVPSDREPSPREAFSEYSDYRWDWKTRRFYQIVDKAKYADRLNMYWEMVDRFYRDVTMNPPLTKTRDFNVYSLNGGKIGVAAFNSCHGNDCFAYHGAIRREAISDCHLLLGTAKFDFQLWVSVWHHNIEGPPYRADYMDPEVVQNMIGRNFRLGLFGHQHRNQAEPRHIYLPDEETMAVVSAGSLCAGYKELPTGYFRQYNIIEIDDDFQSARVHVRQMSTAQLFSRAHMPSVGGRSYVDLRWKTPYEISSKRKAREKSGYMAAVLEAESLSKGGKSADALLKLEVVRDQLDSFGRTVYLDAAAAEKQWSAIVALVSPPKSIDELGSLVTALEKLGQFDTAKKALEDHGETLGMSAPLLKEWQRRLSILDMAKK